MNTLTFTKPCSLTFTITVPVDYWQEELSSIIDDTITFNCNDDDTVTMYCHDTADELIQGMTTADLVEWCGVDYDYVLSTNHEDLK